MSPLKQNILDMSLWRALSTHLNAVHTRIYTSFTQCQQHLMSPHKQNILDVSLVNSCETSRLHIVIRNTSKCSAHPHLYKFHAVSPALDVSSQTEYAGCVTCE
ncbi:hypothetical protein J6590_067971 [Homalodisca vitripennis]|nr:hypothetical protein J6590_067971 [Homalodisca vitripennis]